MTRPLRPLFAVVAAAVVAHLVLGLLVGRLQPRSEDMRRTAHAEFESIYEEAAAIRVALEIDRMRHGYIDEFMLGKMIRRLARENLGMTLRAEGWESIRIEQGLELVQVEERGGGAASWIGYGDVRRGRKPYTVTLRKGPVSRGSVVTVEEGRR